jgi:pimeloyl-ACP methyl ester carboxylesterase
VALGRVAQEIGGRTPVSLRLRPVATATRTTKARDGRSLAFEEWGDPNGFPVFSLHGTPGSRFNRHYDEGLYVRAGARVITYDRPGYGKSDRQPGRAVVNCVEDVAALADTLEIHRFAVIGGSGGGPHALAVAARLPERVERATCAVGVAPYDPEDFDWFDGMDPENVKEMQWGLEGEAVLVANLEREAAEVLARVAVDPSKIIGDEFELPESDRLELARPERQDVIRQAVNESVVNGVWGWADDDLAFLRSWGFEVSEIRIPTRVIYGTTDVLVPRNHGEWLAKNVPGAEVVIEDHQGHVPDPESMFEIFRWLAQPS